MLSKRSICCGAVVVAVLLVLTVSTFFISAKQFPPKDGERTEPDGVGPGTEEIELADQQESTLRHTMSDKLKGTGEDVVDDTPDADEAEATPDDDTPAGAEYAAGGGRARGNTNSHTEVRPHSSACDKDPKSVECQHEMKMAADAGDDEQVRLNRTSKDTATYGHVAERFEYLLNEWACTATGNPLFSVRGDHDILNYIFRIVSHAFLEQGQHYGSNIVIEWHTARENKRQAGELDAYNCDIVRLGDERHFSSVLTAMLLHRDLMFKWLEDNEVESQAVLTAYVPEMRSMIKKWTLGRLMHAFGECIQNATNDEEEARDVKNCPARNNEMILALLPILKDENNPLDECQAGGQLISFIDENREASVYREVSRMLDACYESGKLAEDPIEFGETLRSSGREKQARELFELAVQRGKLCNIWQRPEDHHRKDLTAAPVWTEESFPVVKNNHNELRDMMRRLEKNMNWTAVADVHPMMRSGWWQRAWIYGNHNFNTKVTDTFPEADVKRIQEIITDIRAGNDAYEWGCNGSILIEMWRISGDSPQSDKTLGATNLVLQSLTPVRGSKRIVFQLGEDTAQIDPASADDVLVFDDSFEHRFYFEGVTPSDGRTAPGTKQSAMNEERKDDLVLLHLQLCHPEMHEKALDPPGKFCADTEWE